MLLNIHVAITGKRFIFPPRFSDHKFKSQPKERIFSPLPSALGSLSNLSGILEKWMQTLIPASAGVTRESRNVGHIAIYHNNYSYRQKSKYSGTRGGRTWRQKLRFTCRAQIYRTNISLSPKKFSIKRLAPVMQWLYLGRNLNAFAKRRGRGIFKGKRPPRGLAEVFTNNSEKCRVF